MLTRNLRLLMIFAIGVPAFSNDASMFRGDAAHSGIYGAAGAPRSAALKWKFQTRSAVMSSPAVVAGVLYAGSNDHNLYALDANSGTIQWKFKTAGRVSS